MPKKAVASPVKRVPLNMKTTPEIRAKLEAAAAASGRSLTHEVEYRLEKSIEAEEAELAYYVNETVRRYGREKAISLLQGRYFKDFPDS